MKGAWRIAGRLIFLDGGTGEHTNEEDPAMNRREQGRRDVAIQSQHTRNGTRRKCIINKI